MLQPSPRPPEVRRRHSRGSDRRLSRDTSAGPRACDVMQQVLEMYDASHPGMIAVRLASVGEAQRGSKCLHQEFFFTIKVCFVCKQ